MLGSYKGFPQNAHKTALLASSVSAKRLQGALTKALRRLNTETLNLEEANNPSIPGCQVIFEFGIAENQDFNYLSDQETEKVLKTIGKKPLQLMDFLCVVRYYKVKEKKKTPLKFDYYMLRFMFNGNSVTLQVYHDRGTRHITPEEIINIISNKINEVFSKKVLKTVDAD